ncbi:hypothetical protein A9Z40_03040 [Microbacterium arborescens]|uniref:Lipoprotein n=1 Tax=Microbacterium arborescens TaxID=33883 RepID=A0ABX2WI86_9MICO|nr:hypothetical protein [Microbacterium arborescens]OAZ40932.1 hypothetical protein A9Z40_03040 [Microbacterium arborescens]
MKSRTAPLAALALAAVTLSACTATEAPAPKSSEPAAVATQTPAPTEAASADEAEARDAKYQAAVAAWPDAPPAGYAWPAHVTDLPTIGSQAIAAQRVDGIYRCMLIDAAWVAYFEDNDAERAIDLATRADDLYDGSTSSVAVTVDGRVHDRELATANGICQGSVGDLKG